MNKPNKKDLLLALGLSLPAGILLANIYLNQQYGFNVAAMNELDHFGILHNSPLILGYVSDAFLTALYVVTGTMVAAMVLVVVLNSSPKHFGSAKWADFSDMARKGFIKPYARITTPIFGKTTSPKLPGKYLTNGPHPHSLVVAPTRAGKGVGVVVPTLLTFDGSIVALDVKGELFEMTSRSRLARGDRVFKFAPMDKQGKTHCYNPVADIVATPPERRFTETRRLASNLITPKGKGAEGFIDGARDLFVAGILACIERGTPTIGAVYELFAQPGEKYKLFAELAEQSSIPEVQRIFDNMAGNDTKIITSYTSVLGDGGLNLWADPLIKNATSRSDFSIYELRRNPTSVFLCVSPNDLEVIAPLVRLFFQQLVSILQRQMPEKDETFEVLFLLDEFKHLGKLEAIATAITTIAGYNGRFMFIIQSLSALTGAYEQSGKENFLSNCGIQVFMATADDETPQYISKAIGDYTFTNKSKSYSTKSMFESNISATKQGVALIRPEQVRLLDDDTQIVLVKGQPPLKMPKVKYYADRVLKKLFFAQKGPLPEPEAIEPTATVQPIAPMVTETTAPAPEQEQAQSTYQIDEDDLIYDDEPSIEEMLEMMAAMEMEEAGGQREQADENRFDRPPEAEIPNREPPPPEAVNAQQALLEQIVALQTQSQMAASA